LGFLIKYPELQEYQKKNFIKFQRHIGFKHPRKIKKLQLLLDSYNATSRNKAAFEKLKNELARPPK